MRLYQFDKEIKYQSNNGLAKLEPSQQEGINQNQTNSYQLLYHTYFTLPNIKYQIDEYQLIDIQIYISLLIQYQMSTELLEQSDYITISNNQISVIEQLDKTNSLINNANQLSNKFVGEAIHNFKKGTQAIARIRNNLDQIHKALSAIHKARSAKKA